jgi:hypothetical protein
LVLFFQNDHTVKVKTPNSIASVSLTPEVCRSENQGCQAQLMLKKIKKQKPPLWQGTGGSHL